MGWLFAVIRGITIDGVFCFILYKSLAWKRFQDAREKYSDNLKINKELRDYDFKIGRAHV